MMWKLAALLLASPMPALACSPVEPPGRPPSQEEIDAGIRATFESASDLVDYVVVRRATTARNGAIRVTRSYKGAIKPGTRLPIWTTHGAACGSGDAERGSVGRMFLTGEAPFQYGRMADPYFDELARLKLVPAR